jgi:Uma2 family endonuclease
MAPIGAPHFGMVNRLTGLLPAILAGRGILSIQNPVRLDDGSEPEPDVVVLKPRDDYYETAAPRPEDVLLLIEVADTSLRDDRDVKVPLYAESGIQECWLVNLVDRVVEVYRQPENGRYVESRRIGPDGVLDIMMLPGAVLPAIDVLRLPSQ